MDTVNRSQMRLCVLVCILGDNKQLLSCCLDSSRPVSISVYYLLKGIEVEKERQKAETESKSADPEWIQKQSFIRINTTFICNSLAQEWV